MKVEMKRIYIYKLKYGDDMSSKRVIFSKNTWKITAIEKRGHYNSTFTLSP